jgi:hypothetical protein
VNLFNELRRIAMRSTAAKHLARAEDRSKPAKPARPKPKPDPFACPDGEDPRAWAVAARNVALGSAPCSLTRAELRSTEPSDETLRREHAFAETMRRREQEHHRNQFHSIRRP